MLQVLIVEPDPVVSLDLSEAAKQRFAGATVEGVHSLSDAQTRLRAGHAMTHLFIRKPEPDDARETYDFISSMARSGTTIVLIGAESPPAGVEVDPLLCLSLPFTNDMLDTVFARSQPRA